MKRILLILSIFFAASFTADAQRVALKNNILGDATASINLAVEMGLGSKSVFGKRTTLEIYASYNPFELGDVEFKHLMGYPEFRYWFCEAFNGLFVGIHGLGGSFNVAGIEAPFKMFPEIQNNRFKGYFYGGGLSVGYQWIVGKRWNIEAMIGGGYIRADYDKFGPLDGNSLNLGSGNADYFGITRASVSVVFFFN